MSDRDDELLRALLARVVPGSALREGLERILGAHLGALIVLGDGARVLEISTGGFHIDEGMTPQRLSELAKMDGAIVLQGDASRIVWANVHLMPDPTTPTQETGTRHRTAERVARSLGVPVIVVSEETETITLYRGAERRQLESTVSLFSRTTHLLQILERFKGRLGEVNAALRAAEVEGRVTVRELATVVQRATMVVRVAREIGDLIDELGTYGRLFRLQLDELVVGIDDDLRLVLADYLDPGRERTGPEALDRLELLSTDELLDLDQVLETVISPTDAAGLDSVLVPQGLRLLERLDGLDISVTEQLRAHFGDLRRLLAAPASRVAELVGMPVESARRVQRELVELAASEHIWPSTSRP